MTKSDSEMESTNPIKKKITSLFERLNIDLDTVDIELPYEAPQKYIFGAIVVFLVFLLSGGIYNLAENNEFIGNIPGVILVVYPQINTQFFFESFIAAFFIGLGAIGAFLIRYSTRFAYDLRFSITVLTVGITILTVAVIGITIVYNFKARIG